MSYDLGLVYPGTKEYITLDQPHQMRGGTYAIGGSDTAELNVTYNYGKHFNRVFRTRNGVNGLRSIYGLTGEESIRVLDQAISLLGDDIADDYWEATEGNAKLALRQLRQLALMCPEGVWHGD